MNKVSIEEIVVKNIIIHILDTSMSIPVISEYEMPTAVDINEYFASQISKLMSNDSLRDCEFDDAEYNWFYNNFSAFSRAKTSFKRFSAILAGQLFAVMSAHITIPSADLAIVRYRYKQEDYLAMLKLNYHQAYIHQTNSDERMNSLIQHRTTLPGMNQQIIEAAIMHIEDKKVYVLDKLYDIDGEKVRYLSKLFFKCRTELSAKERYKAIESSLDRVTKKFFDDDVEKKAEISEKLYEALDETGKIDLKEFSAKVFNGHEEIKDILFETLEKKGIEEAKVPLEEATIERAFKVKKIKTDDGIEIKIPMDFYNNPNRMKFVAAANGRIELHLLDINKII